MHSDFEPVHLKETNEKLDKILSDFKRPQEKEKEIVKKSLWKKFLDLFKRNPFELPDDLSK